MTLPTKIVVIGGSAAGMGAAGAAKQADPQTQVTVFTELSDAAYSPCGIPYVHGREIDSFDRLVLQTKGHYREQGLDIHYETHVESIDLAKGEVVVRGSGRVPFDRLMVGTGFSYETPDIPGTDLDGIYYVRDLRLAREWDKRLDKAKTAVVVEAQPIGVEMATALARRGIETYLVDPHPWPMAEMPQGFTRIPVQGLSGSHAYAQGKVAGANAGGGSRTYRPVYVPWGLVGGNWMIGGVSFGETLANALGVPFVLGVAEGISRARYYPDFRKIRVKLLADPKTLQVIGAQLVGGEGIKERCDLLALAARRACTLEDLAWMENVYSPAMGALNEPIALAAQDGLQRAGRS